MTSQHIRRTGVVPQCEISANKSNRRVTLNTEMLATQQGKLSKLPDGKQWTGHTISDAPEVPGYGESLGVTPTKMTLNVPQDDVIKYTNFHLCITTCSVITAFKDH